MDYTLTVLIDNNAPGGLTPENGFSALLERGGRQLLFDCGHTGAVIENAQALGIELRPGAVVLSHNHYDHAGGLLRLIRERPGFDLYLSRHFFKECYWVDAETGERNDTQSAVTEELLSGYPAVKRVGGRVTPVPGFDGVFILGGFRRLDFEPVDTSNFAVRGETVSVDDYRDEIALAIKAPGGLTVISGCAHCGAAGICTAAEERLGAPVRRFFGGTHLMVYGEQRAEDTASYFERKGFEAVGACHCTGEAGLRALSRLGSYIPVSAGFSAKIPSY